MADFSKKLPIWYQLSQILKNEILKGALLPGEKIDSEVRLAARYGISVIPVRQALRALEGEDLIVRRKGSGTYVNESLRPANQGITSLAALYAREFDTPAQILDLGLTPIPAQFATYFPQEEKLGYVRRLAFRNGAPLSYGTLYFRQEFASELTLERLARYPLYRLIQDIFPVRLASSHFEARAVAAGNDAALYLQVDPFSPALALASVTFDSSGIAAGAFDLTFSSDPFVFSFDTQHELG